MSVNNLVKTNEKEIAILRTIGYSKWDIQSIFIQLILTIGIFGIFIPSKQGPLGLHLILAQTANLHKCDNFFRKLARFPSRATKWRLDFVVSPLCLGHRIGEPLMSPRAVTVGPMGPNLGPGPSGAQFFFAFLDGAVGFPDQFGTFYEILVRVKIPTFLRKIFPY